MRHYSPVNTVLSMTSRLLRRKTAHTGPGGGIFLQAGDPCSGFRPRRTGLRTAAFLIGGLSVLMTGCASLPDFNRLQANTDRMTYNMGVMASSMPHMVHNMNRMATLAENMQYKVDTMIANFGKRGKTAEKAVQNYMQAMFDNDRAMINNLKGIREELGGLTTALANKNNPHNSADTDEANRKLAAKLQDLEARLKAIESKIK